MRDAVPLRFCLTWSLGTAAVNILVLAILPLIVRLIEPIRLDTVIAILIASQIVVLYGLVFRYIPSWLEWKRRTSLHEAQRLFRHWRDEMRALMHDGPQAALLLEKPKKGLVGGAG